MQVIVPQIIDDISKSYTSYTVVKINEKSSLSSRYYSINLKPYKFKCEKILKLKCKSKVEVYAYLTSFYLVREKDGISVGDYLSSYQIIAEDLGDSYNICIGVLGGSGSVYFTDKSNDSQSYAYIEVIQVCK